MSSLENTFNAESYETRELAWELQQPNPDQQRIKIFLEQEADLRTALQIANMSEKDVMKNPALKPLQLHKRLKTGSENAGL
ncbi:MAG: hypothetical protein GC185_07805 [Alphaproteobacteria bacterium]|nr:hypothetical protein [Alphaproteobacteria bacterium]